MTTQHIETLIIGAGQAGLSTGYHLKQRGREFLIVDGNDRIGDNWRCHYDSLRLFTPAWLNGLDGLDFPAEDRWHFPTKDEFADYLELYAITSDLPVRMQTRVQRLSQSPDGGYIVDLGGDQIACDNVVLAVGSFGRTPVVPPFADDLDPRIRQLHSADYHSPEQLARRPHAGGRRVAQRVGHRLRTGSEQAGHDGRTQPRSHPVRVGNQTCGSWGCR